MKVAHHFYASFGYGRWFLCIPMGTATEAFGDSAICKYLRYVLFSMAVGTLYTLVQIPFAIFYLITTKRLITHYRFLQFEFYGDKVCLMLLATASGAAFGATVETRKGAFKFNRMSGYDAGDYHKEINSFCNMAYVSAGFLLIGFLSSAISSILSSKALHKD